MQYGLSHVVRPLSFEDTTDGNIHQQIITQFISLQEQHEHDCCFQQSGATFHTSNETMSILKDSGKSLISKDLWPQIFPPLNSLNFLLWSYLKGVVYSNNPHTPGELRIDIKSEISKVIFQTLRKISTNITKRVQACIEEQEHFQHLL
jgi:hypothetical protein